MIHVESVANVQCTQVTEGAFQTAQGIVPGMKRVLTHNAVYGDQALAIFSENSVLFRVSNRPKSS